MISKFNDPNLLTLFGSVLGIIGSLILGVDALGAPDFLAALKAQKEKGIQMAHIGFLALVNRTFIYLFISVIGFIIVLILSQGKIVVSLIVAPFIYFGWRLLDYIAERLTNLVKKLGPKNYIENQKGFLLGLGCLAQLLHWVIWAIPFLVVFIFSIIIRFGLDLPLTYLSEKAVVPIIKQMYELSAKVVAEEERWKLKSTALIGSVFLIFGFLYQFIGTLLLLK
jgi:hypothetical protein